MDPNQLRVTTKLQELEERKQKRAEETAAAGADGKQQMSSPEYSTWIIFMIIFLWLFFMIIFYDYFYDYFYD